MGEKPLSRKISALFTTVAAVGLLTPFNLRIGDDIAVTDAAPPTTTFQVLHPVKPPIENVIHSKLDGGTSAGGGGGISFAMSIRTGR